MRKTFKKLLSLTLATTMVVGLAGCGNTASNGGSSDSADKGGGSGKTYTVGICQLVQHEALDAATKGFKTALKDLMSRMRPVMHQPVLPSVLPLLPTIMT